MIAPLGERLGANLYVSGTGRFTMCPDQLLRCGIVAKWQRQPRPICPYLSGAFGAFLYHLDGSAAVGEVR